MAVSTVGNVVVWESRRRTRRILPWFCSERGDTAIYKMADILQDIRELNANSDDESTKLRAC